MIINHCQHSYSTANVKQMFYHMKICATSKHSQKHQLWPKFYHFLAATSQKKYLTNPDEISPRKQNLLIELWLTGMKNSWTYPISHLSE